MILPNGCAFAACLSHVAPACLTRRLCAWAAAGGREGGREGFPQERGTVHAVSLMRLHGPGPGGGHLFTAWGRTRHKVTRTPLLVLLHNMMGSRGRLTTGGKGGVCARITQGC